MVAQCVSGAPLPPLQADRPKRPVESVLKQLPPLAKAGSVGIPFALIESAETEEVAPVAVEEVAR